MPEPIAGPDLEPLSRAEAKLFLRVPHDDEDALMDVLITTARRIVEARTGRILIDQTWRIVRDAWPASGVLAAPVAPVRAIVSATVADAAGSPTPVPAGVLTLAAGRTPGLIHVGPAAPVPGIASGGIVLTLTAGYGPAPGDVPADLVHAVRLVLAHIYEHRDGDVLDLPASLNALLAPYRVVRL